MQELKHPETWPARKNFFKHCHSRGIYVNSMMIRPVAFCLDEKVAIAACQKGCAIPQKKFAVNSYSPLAYIIDNDEVMCRTFSQIGIAPSYVSKLNMFNQTNSKFHRKELVLDHHPEISCKTRFGVWCHIYQLAKIPKSYAFARITSICLKVSRIPGKLHFAWGKDQTRLTSTLWRCQRSSKAVLKTPCEIEIPVGWQGSSKCLSIIPILNWETDSYNSPGILIIAQSYWINGILLQFLLYSDSHQLLTTRIDFGHCSTPVGRSCRNPQEPLPLQKNAGLLVPLGILIIQWYTR